MQKDPEQLDSSVPAVGLHLILLSSQPWKREKKAVRVEGGIAKLHNLLLWKLVYMYAHTTPSM